MINDQAVAFARSFREASRYHRLGNEVEACRHITLALAEEKGLAARLPVLTSYDELYAKVPALALEIETPKRAASLSGFLTLLGRGDLAAMLLVRSAELAPPAPDREPIRADQVLHEALVFAAEGDHAAAAERAALLLALDNAPVDPLLAEIGPMMASNNPGIVVGMANMLLGCGLRREAGLLFSRYLSLAPDAADHADAFEMLDRINAEQLLNLAIAQQRVGQSAMVDRLLRRALSHDPGPERMQVSKLGPDLLASGAVSTLLANVRHPSTVICLRALCEARGSAQSVALCTAWLVPHEATAALPSPVSGQPGASAKNPGEKDKIRGERGDGH